MTGGSSCFEGVRARVGVRERACGCRRGVKRTQYCTEDSPQRFFVAGQTLQGEERELVSNTAHGQVQCTTCKEKRTSSADFLIPSLMLSSEVSIV
jgi:hypothetical protein